MSANNDHNNNLNLIHQNQLSEGISWLQKHGSDKGNPKINETFFQTQINVGPLISCILFVPATRILGSRCSKKSKIHISKANSLMKKALTVRLEQKILTGWPINLWKASCDRLRNVSIHTWIIQFKLSLSFSPWDDNQSNNFSTVKLRRQFSIDPFGTAGKKSRKPVIHRRRCGP